MGTSFSTCESCESMLLDGASIVSLMHVPSPEHQKATLGETDSTCSIFLGFISYVSTRFSLRTSIFKEHSTSLPYKKSHPIADDTVVITKLQLKLCRPAKASRWVTRQSRKKGFRWALQKSLHTTAPGSSVVI